MSSDSISTANYAAVVSDLRAKRDEIDRAIAMLESMARLNPAIAAAPEPATTTDSASRPPVGRPFQPRKGGIGDRCFQIIFERRHKGPVSTRDIIDELVASGFELKTRSPANNIWSALNTRARIRGDVRRVGRLWEYVDLEKARSEAAPPYKNGVAAPVGKVAAH